jgi:hypothetical protein
LDDGEACEHRIGREHAPCNEHGVFRHAGNARPQHSVFLQVIQEGRQKCPLFWEERAIEMAGSSLAASVLR